MRKVSKKIMFVDIIDQKESERRTLLLKFWETPELRDKCTRGPDKIHVGDVIAWVGGFDKDMFLVQSYSFVSKWSDESSQPFKPQPPPDQTKTLANQTKELQECNA